MVSTIFQPQLDELQAQVEALLRRRAQLQQAQTTARKALEALSEAINHITETDSTATSTFKSAVLNLFGGNDTDSDSDPEPTPPTDGGMPNFDNFVTEVKAAFETEPAPLPKTLEPALQTEAKPFVELKMLSEDVGYLANKHGEILAGYAGFSSKQKAQAKGKELSELLHMGYEVRDAASGNKRLPHKYELKVLDISIIQLQKLADELKPRLQPAFDEPKPEPAQSNDLPQFTLIPDTSENALLGQSWFVYGVGDDNHTLYGKVNESLTLKGFRYGKQPDNTIYPTPEDAAKAAIRRKLAEKKTHDSLNQSVVNSYLERESDPFGGFRAS